MKNYVVETEFTYKGFKCVIIMHRLGHRCGYVGVPAEHPLYGKEYEDYFNISKPDIRDLYECDQMRIDEYFTCHGGITYSGGGTESNYPIKSDLWWFGFDCAHSCDKPDYDSAMRLFADDEEVIKSLGRSALFKDSHFQEVRSADYVYSECMSLVEQLIEYEEEVYCKEEEETPEDGCSLKELFDFEIK